MRCRVCWTTGTRSDSSGPDYPLWTGLLGLSAASSRCIPLREGRPACPGPRPGRGSDHLEDPRAGCHHPTTPPGPCTPVRRCSGCSPCPPARAASCSPTDLRPDPYSGACTSARRRWPPTCGSLPRLASKTYRCPVPHPAGWSSPARAVTGAAEYLEGLEFCCRTFGWCPNVPAQHAIAPALGGQHSVTDLLRPGVGARAA